MAGVVARSPGGIARALLIEGTRRPLRVLCARETQKSVADSVHYLLKGQIDQLGLSGFYNVLKSEISAINGTMFIFAGIRQNVSNIKSYESVDICWAEEAQNVNKSSWEVLIPTILRFRYPSTPSWKRTTLPAICDSAPTDCNGNQDRLA